MEIKVVRKILEENDNAALAIRRKLRSRNQCMVNFMSSPGSGKTLLLEKLIPLLLESGLRVGVIEGDISTARDAMRLQHLGIPIAQINTEFFGGDCHLAAPVVMTALQALEEHPLDIVLLENVGNLVCPAEFDTGSDLNVTLLSVTEGEDKPLKYPLMFRSADLALISKTDLIEATEADVPLIRRNMRQINGELKILEVSAKKGVGLNELKAQIVELHRKTTV
ncbi:MAG: hydrogenase accessory protein HypB [Bdellovibrionales bacterium GWB1_55_8]|nr:MAG: hydrogenase accessory protein HypB [Bdellovibrionales bacterium GWB1_55_8]